MEYPSTVCFRLRANVTPSTPIAFALGGVSKIRVAVIGGSATSAVFYFYDVNSQLLGSITYSRTYATYSVPEGTVWAQMVGTVQAQHEMAVAWGSGIFIEYNDGIYRTTGNGTYMQAYSNPFRVVALQTGTYNYVACKYDNINMVQSWIVGSKDCSANETIITADSSGKKYLLGVVWI